LKLAGTDFLLEQEPASGLPTGAFDRQNQRQLIERQTFCKKLWQTNGG
jgi:hypothetical protein